MAKNNAIIKNETLVTITKGLEAINAVKNHAADILLKKDEKTLSTCGFNNSPCINLIIPLYWPDSLKRRDRQRQFF